MKCQQFLILLKKKGKIEDTMMYNTFNMGLGMVLAVKAEDADKTVAAIKEGGLAAYIVGEAKSGDKGVILC